jgi:hypothetical protein
MDIPVFLISFNRVTYLSMLVTWLEAHGYSNIQIVDNASTYPPLLDYLRSSPHKVHYLNNNMGHLAVWTCGRFTSELSTSYYIVSDCDILPVEQCPGDAVWHFQQVLEMYPEVTKVGFSLRIDDLPDSYVFKDEVINWEAQYWQKEIAPELFAAPIDTTFALYRPGIYPSQKKWWTALRTGAPYTARHLPWYQNSQELSDEEQYYQRSAEALSTHWSITDVQCIKEQNKLYHKEITTLRKEINSIRKNYFLVNKNPGALLKACVRKPYATLRRALKLSASLK